MKTKAVLLKLAIIALQLASLAILFVVQVRLVIWAEQTYSLEKSNFPWTAAMLLTLIPLTLIAAIFYRTLKRLRTGSKAQVFILGAILFLVGVIGARGVMQLNNFLKAGNHSTAIASLQKIHKAQSDFKAKNNKYALLQELVDAKLIRPNYLTEEGTRGYKYSDTDISAETFCIHADRIKNGMGNKDFHVTESGEIRFIEAQVKGTVPRGQGKSFYSSEE